MRKLQLFITVLINYIIQAQTISPSETLEYCPIEEYTFTVSFSNSNLTSASIVNQIGLQYAYVSSFNSSSATIKARFSDINTNQAFDLSYCSGNCNYGNSIKTFTFSN